MCDGTDNEDNPFSTLDFIENSLTNLGGTLTLGCPGHSVTVTSGNGECVIEKLPGGGASGPIPAGDFNLCTLPG
jgi:hypothetical protein